MSSKIKNNNLSLIFGAIFAVINVIVIFTVGSPYDVAHKMSSFKMVPPVWLWCLSTVIFGFLMGYALGIAALELTNGRACGEREMWAYRGTIAFVASFLLSLACYPEFFVDGRLLLSLILAFFALVCAIICAVCWSKISASATAIMVLFSLWIAYVLFVNGYVVLNI